MNVTVTLPDVVEALQSQSEELTYFFDRRTGRLELIADEAIVGEDEQMATIAEAVEADTEGRFVPLPDEFETHEWEMMDRFARQLEDADVGESLLRAINGRGAFRCFKDRIHELGIAEQWYSFRDEQYRRIAIDWCESNGIECREAPCPS